jgi:CRISPR-associated protein Cmr1
MKRETFQVELVTPCFLAGAAGRAEWRAASIRGQLRWWFRAVAGGVYAGNLGKVREAEELIFGSTVRRSSLRIVPLQSAPSDDSPFGSKLLAADLARLYGDPSAKDRLRLPGNKGEEGSNPIYYLAFGPVRKKIERDYLPPSSLASFQMQWGPGTPGGQPREIFDQALWAWLNLGGLGAKSRKGFGSLCCQNNSFYTPPADLEGFKGQAKALLATVQGFKAEPQWTHFSSRSRIFIGDGCKDWEGAMERLGAWMIGFRRRYGSKSRDPRVIDGIPLAGRDYEWAAPKGGDLRKETPDRAGFGLPLPFTRKETDPKTGDKVTRGETVLWGSPGMRSDQEQESRRASPLLLHVSKLGSSFYPVLTYLPAVFLPPGGQLKFKRSRVFFHLGKGQLRIIDHFLSALQTNGVIREIQP